MQLGMVVGLGPCHIVLDGDPAPPPQNRSKNPQFWAHVYCGQMARWIKMPLGTKLGLGPGDLLSVPSHRFRNIAFDRSKIAIFGYPSYGFSAAEKDSGVKLCVLVRLLSEMSFSHLGELWPRDR